MSCNGDITLPSSVSTVTKNLFLIKFITFLFAYHLQKNIIKLIPNEPDNEK